MRPFCEVCCPSLDAVAKAVAAGATPGYSGNTIPKHSFTLSTNRFRQTSGLNFRQSVEGRTALESFISGITLPDQP